MGIRLSDSLRTRIDEEGREKSFQNAILAGLSRKPSGQIYQGTVPPAEKARRRAANKQARKSRQINRTK